MIMTSYITVCRQRLQILQTSGHIYCVLDDGCYTAGESTCFRSCVRAWQECLTRRRLSVCRLLSLCWPTPTERPTNATPRRCSTVLASRQVGAQHEGQNVWGSDTQMCRLLARSDVTCVNVHFTCIQYITLDSKPSFAMYHGHLISCSVGNHNSSLKY